MFTKVKAPNICREEKRRYENMSGDTEVIVGSESDKYLEENTP